MPSLSYGIWYIYLLPQTGIESSPPAREHRVLATREVPTLMLLISKTFTCLLPVSVIYAVDFSDITVIMLRTFLLYLISWVFSMNRYWIFSNAFSASRWSYDFWFFTLWIFYMFFSLITDGLTLLCFPTVLWLIKKNAFNLSFWDYNCFIFWRILVHWIESNSTEFVENTIEKKIGQKVKYICLYQV